MVKLFLQFCKRRSRSNETWAHLEALTFDDVFTLYSGEKVIKENKGAVTLSE